MDYNKRVVYEIYNKIYIYNIIYIYIYIYIYMYTYVFFVQWIYIYIYSIESVFHWQFLITYIFSVSRACCIMGQWGKFTGNSSLYKNATLYLHIVSLYFCCCFSPRKKMCFYNFHFFFFDVLSNFCNRILTIREPE